MNTATAQSTSSTSISAVHSVHAHGHTHMPSAHMQISTTPAQSITTPAPTNASTTTVSTSTARSRQQSRKKAAVSTADDASYRGDNGTSVSIGSKRTAGAVGAGSGGGGIGGAAATADGTEPRKRKRVDHSASQVQREAIIVSVNNTTSAKLARPGDGPTESNNSAAPLFEFSKLPSSSLMRYITSHDIIPVIFPNPMTKEDPPLPSYLLDPAKWDSQQRQHLQQQQQQQQQTSPPVVTTALQTTQAQQQQQHQQISTISVTPANRLRRNKDKEGIQRDILPGPTTSTGLTAPSLDRRRSSRSNDSSFSPDQIQPELPPTSTSTPAIAPGPIPVLADVRDVHTILAQIAQKHYRESYYVKEVETLAAFMCAVKSKQGRWR